MDASGFDSVMRSEVVRVWLLSGFRVSVGSRTIRQEEWRLKKAAHLIKLLALSPSHRLHREQAMDLLWPDLGRRAAANNLRKTLRAARRTLDPDEGSDYLASEGESLVLCPVGQLWVDVEAFEEAAATARRSNDPAAYRAALDLYGGELLPGDRYKEWVEEHRRQLRESHLSLLLGLARLHEGLGDYERSIETLRRAVAEESTNEEAHVGLMRLYALSGSKAEALRQYESLREIIFRDLQTEPSASSRALREEIASGRNPPPYRPTTTDAEGAASLPRHNLPASRTSFVGREREKVEVKRMLAMTRLLTLSGAGGSGKTRLAMEVARDLVGAYPDGVWLVELAPLSESTLVPQEVARILGTREHPGRSVEAVLIEDLRQKEMLLILDNCEHLVEAAARLVDTLLSACPRLRILTTSREALNVAGEVGWLVPSLLVPDPGLSPTVGELEGFESARLFLERASERRPGFALVPANAQPVAEICRTLEGMPLAIELGAARIKTLSVGQLSERLADSLKLLTGGSRTQTPRQRTLRNTLDWSHDLLSEPERAMLRRLSVFAGGWTLEAAEAVGSGGNIGKDDVLDLLSGLVDKSLVVARGGDERGVRYRLLEPVRQYAWEKLGESGEAETLQYRRATFFLNLAEEAKAQLEGPEQAEWFERLEIAHDNFRAALSWTLGGGDPNIGLRLASALWMFWDTRGHLSEGSRWLEDALNAANSVDSLERAEALNGLGEISRTLLDLGRAQMCHEEALALYERLGDPQGVAKTIYLLGLVAQYRGEAARAAALFEESMTAARQSGNQALIPGILSALGWLAADEGDFERAQRMWGEALAAHRKRGDILGISFMLEQLGYSELAQGNMERATPLLEEALALSRDVGHKGIVMNCLTAFGIIATRRGDTERARTLLRESLTIELELGLEVEIPDLLETMAELAGTMDDDLRAARLWGAAEALRQAMGLPRPPWIGQGSAEAHVLDAPSVFKKTWEAEFAEGRAMGLEEAVEYALSEEESSAATSNVAERSSTEARLPAVLTHREEEIAVLVTRGLTNRQIASELVISERTVDHHVASILKKLKVASREGVASRLHKQ
jgi:predicted ATPase/DNA-binding SARP family transcriptional activator/DNA-binding CsgD family transcriptional regulator